MKPAFRTLLLQLFGSALLATSLTARLAPRGGSGSLAAGAAERAPMGPHVPQEDPADEAWSNGDTELARRLYEERLAADPNDDVALHRLALMYAWAEEYDEAHELFDRLLELEPDNLDARVDRDRVWAWAGDTDRALDDLSAILEAHPDHAGALEARALFEAWAGRYEESLTNYEQLLAIAPDDGAARRQQAQVLSWATRYDASRAVYDSLLAQNPDDVESRLGLATVLMFSDDLDGAIAEYDRILSAHPDEVRALQGKGRALAWGDHLIEGEEVVRRAVELDGTNAASLAGLAQVLRWQDRNAAALEVLRKAEAIAPTDGDVREQLRAVNLALSPITRPGFVWESDSDHNRMLTSSLSAGWHPTPRLDVRVHGYRRDLEQDALNRSAMGVTVTASYQLEPGWTVSAGGGGSRTDGSGKPSFLVYQLGVRSPSRHPFTGRLDFAVIALDATALLAERGVKTTSGTLSGRWAPGSGWRVDVALGLARFEGTRENDRKNGSLSVSSRVGGAFTLAGSLRAFGFERDLNDGYFDPDFYGIGELNARWLAQPTPWTFLFEVAPGVQKVTSNGDPAPTFRGSVRVGYRIAPGQEVSVSGGYSSTGLQSFSTGASDYRYTAVIVGVDWTF